MENSPGSATPQKPRTYYGFISYSHRDSALVRRLHRELELYRVPQRLVGKPSPVIGVISQRLHPIFLDREELPSSANLSTPIHETLNHSYTLIAACSPYSAASRWVNSEVQYFKQIGKADRVMCVILDGEPNATDKPELGKPECFCPALRHAVDTEGRLTERREEPLAADIRREADGWKRAKLKLIAGMLGISFDELNQRERERMRVRHAWQLATAIIVLIAACIGGFLVNEYYRHLESRGYAKRANVELDQRHYLAAALYAEASANVRADTAELPGIVRELAKAFPEPVATLQSNAARLEHVVFSHDNGRTVYAAGSDGKLYRWKLDAPQLAPASYEIGTIKNRPLARLALPKPNGPLLIAAWDASITLWDPATEKVTHRIGAHFKRTRITGLALDPTQPRFATAGDDGYVKLWSLAGLPALTNGAPFVENVAALRELAEHDDLAKCVAISRDGTKVASGGFDSTLYLISADGSSKLKLQAGDSLNAVIFSADGRLVLAAGRSGNVQAFDTSGANPKPEWSLDKAHSNRINDLALTPDGSAFITAADDGAIRVWSMKDRALMLTVEHESTVPAIGKKEEVKFLGVAVSDDGSLIAGSQSDGKVRVWKNAPAKAGNFGDLQPLLSKRVEVRWDRGALKPRPP
jgi:WD40 repeat protein